MLKLMSVVVLFSGKAAMNSLAVTCVDDLIIGLFALFIVLLSAPLLLFNHYQLTDGLCIICFNYVGA